MASGARSKFGAPMFEAEVFRKQIYCIEESTCDTVGTFWRPHSNLAPGELRLLAPPCYAPARLVVLKSCLVPKWIYLNNLVERLNMFTNEHFVS